MAGEPKTYTQDQLDAEVAGLKASRAEVMDDLKAIKKKIAAFEGLDPDEARKAVKDAAELDRQRQKDAGDWDAREKSLIETHKTERLALEGRVEKLTRSMHKRAVQAELTKAIITARGDPNLLLHLAEPFVKVKEDGDEFVAFVSDDAGHQRTVSGVPMTFDQLVEEELKPKYPRAFDGTGSSGGGASRSTTGGSGRVATVAEGDNAAFLANLDNIAKGDTVVR